MAPKAKYSLHINDKQFRTPMIKYRLATPDDIKELAKLRYQYWLESGTSDSVVSKEGFLDCFTSQVKEAMSNGELFCWLALKENNIVATLYIQIVKKLPKPSKVSDQFGYASNFYTVPEMRDKGIGSEVLERAKEWALAKDLEFIIAWPSQKSTGLWQQKGFAQDEALVCEMRSYIN